MELNITLDQLDRIIEYGNLFKKGGYNWSLEDGKIMKRLREKRNKIME